MGFFRNLFKGKSVPAAAPKSGGLDLSGDLSPDTEASRAAADLINDMTSEIEDAPEGVNIWDYDGAGPQDAGADEDVDLGAMDEPAAAAAPTGRARRNKTRLIGFETSSSETVDLFDGDDDDDDADLLGIEPEEAADVRLPVGWLVITDGPGRGNSFTLYSGLTQMGRGEDQAVQLDFGDAAISRTNHASIVFDDQTQEYLLGHGGKSNIVRLNDAAVVSNEALKTGDVMRLGETSLRFIALCEDGFSWTAPKEEENENVATA